MAVGIAKIQATSNGYAIDNPNEVVLLYGSKCTLKAFPDPAGAEWPSGKPLWKCGAQAWISDAIEINATIVGSFVYTVECGNSKTITVTVTVVKPEVVSVDFRGGGVQDIYDVGTEPEWVKSPLRNEPFTVIKSKSFGIYAKFIASKNLTFPTNVKVCEHADAQQNSSPATWQNWQSAEVGRSRNDTPDSIRVTSFSPSWRYSADGGSNWHECGNSTHEMYVTWDTFKCLPADFTKDHIDYVVSKANNSTSLEQAADKLGPDAVSGNRFDLFNNCETTPWDIIDIPMKADCVSLCAFMKHELALLGDNSAELWFVYACNASWNSLASTSRLSNETCIAHGHPLLFWAGGGLNNWEACLRYKNQWWLGGCGVYKDHPVEVLRMVTSPNTATADTPSSGNHQCLECLHPVPYPDTNTPAGRVIPDYPYPPSIPQF